MYLLLLIVVWILFAYKFIDWSQVKKQYPSVLFFIVINMTFNYFYYDYSLWEFRGVTADWLNHSIINTAFTFFICPMGLIIYLQRFPTNRVSQLIYFTAWVTFYVVLTAIFAHRGLFVYDNGWNGWWNIPLNIVLFGVLYIHYRNPVRAIALSLLFAILFYFAFPFPFESLK